MNQKPGPVPKRKLFRLRNILIFLLVVGAAITAFAYWSAVRDPVVREANVEIAVWPEDTAPLTIAFLSDIHVAGPDMPPSRVAEIVESVNTLEPDLVLLGGDFVSDKRTATASYTASEGLASLENLRAPAFAVLGNHDYWRGRHTVEAALRSAGVTVLDNQSTRFGPLNLIGISDEFTDHDDLDVARRAVSASQGPNVIFTHSPDIVPELRVRADILLAGHSHCGQIRLPLVGAVSYMSKYGERFGCGRTEYNSMPVITSAGLGTSIVPLRLGTSPEIWLVTLGPVN